jgi:hypothetical protein
MRKAPGAAVAGLGATLIMKYVSSFLYERHSGQVREREDRLRPEMPTTRCPQAHPEDRQRARREVRRAAGNQPPLRLRRRGRTGGRLLVSRGNDPLKAALTVAAMEIAVDQLANTALGLTAPTGNDAQPGQRQGDARRQPNPRHRVGDRSTPRLTGSPTTANSPRKPTATRLPTANPWTIRVGAVGNRSSSAPR